jgi:hypothetical protein
LTSFNQKRLVYGRKYVMILPENCIFCGGRKEKGLEYVKKLRDMHFMCADYSSDFAKKLISA